jgi:twinkle protein
LILAERLLAHGILPRDYREGNHKIPCPRCSHTRKKRNDPCLSLTIERDRAVWLCHHCQWNGTVNEREDHRPHRQRPVAAVKPSATPGDPSPALLQWFAKRGISAATVRRNRIWAVRHYIPALKAEVDCIAFPCFRNGELVNIKFRVLAEKAFARVKGAETILYGLDNIADSKSAVIVEGELDKLALEEAGIRNVVSVPDGAPVKIKAGEPDPEDAKFAFLANCAEYLDRLDRIILAVDDDGPGLALAEELARRLGKERCWRVRWPDTGDAPCKGRQRRVADARPRGTARVHRSR